MNDEDFSIQISDEIENEEIRRKIETDNDDFDKNNTKISKIFLTTASFSLSEYSDRLNRRVFFKPEFQRNKVWTPTGQSKFIESLILGYPVTQVLLYKSIQNESYMIVDGFQRITTINEFMTNKLILNGISDELDGKSFENLDANIKERLLNRQLPALVIEQVEEDVFTLYKIFERVNTGGQNLNNMEIRRAVGYGNLIRTLEGYVDDNGNYRMGLNDDINWRKILGSKQDNNNKYIKNNRFLDVELLLRLMAFYYSWDPYSHELKIKSKIKSNNIIQKEEKYSSMKSFLTSFLENNKNDYKEDFIEVFKTTCELVIKELGENPFKLYSKYNYVILDSVMTSILLAGGQIENLKEKFDIIKQEEEFKKIYEAKQGTTSASKVNGRLRIVLNIIK